MIETASSDLRQGVTATQHEVLDLIERNALSWSYSKTYLEHLEAAASDADLAATEEVISTKRALAIEAAARLLFAAEQMRRMLGPASTE